MRQSFGTRLRERARQLDMSDAEVARRLGISERRYGNYVTDEREPDFDLLPKICRALETHPSYLFGFTADPSEPDSSLGRDGTPAGTQPIAQIPFRAAAGGGYVEREEAQERRWYMPRAWVEQELRSRAADLQILPVFGDSMEPIIRDGDLVVFNRAWVTPTPPGVFVLNDGMAQVVKQLEHVPNSDPAQIRISSRNAAYQSYERTVDETHIAGRVVGVIRRL